ncbi:MAG: hypothetical protein FJ104_09635, partial [Deltaproteobacteria bacterium]|nr:hypothetical protein [Deltaproteobacteria bacterium]
MTPPVLRDLLGIGLALGLLGCTDDGARQREGGGTDGAADARDAGRAELLPPAPA